MRNTILAAVLLGLTACSNIETVDTATESGQRIRYERRKSDQAKEGRYQRFYANGQVEEESFFKNDSLHGEQKFFYENGQLDHSYVFDNGQPHGPYRKFRPNGSLEIEQQYVHGALDGWSIRYYPNGQVEEKVMLKNNEEHGPFTEYYPGGQLKAEGTYDYLDDAAVEQGELREYDSTGTLVRIADCQDGICRTRWKK